MRFHYPPGGRTKDYTQFGLSKATWITNFPGEEQDVSDSELDSNYNDGEEENFIRLWTVCNNSQDRITQTDYNYIGSDVWLCEKCVGEQLRNV